MFPKLRAALPWDIPSPRFSSMDDRNARGSAVVARFMDGRVVKGITHDFAPEKLVFHLSVWGDSTGRALTVPIGALKALFFVKSFEGDPKRVDDDDIHN